jgi:hypothetical protein
VTRNARVKSRPETAFHKELIAALCENCRLALVPAGHIADAGEPKDHHEPGSGLGHGGYGFKSENRLFRQHRPETDIQTKRPVSLICQVLVRSGQRTVPVVRPAGGGVWSRTVDPGVPLGPGLLGTCVAFSHARAAIAKMIATAITAKVRNLIELFRS